MPLGGPALVGRLGEIAEAYGIGRGIHVGETALGIKGRIGFEAGAALILIGAHRELEKLVLTKWQTFWKDQLGRFYGDRLHEGHYFDPALRDIEALITSSQARVTGDTRVRLAPGRFQVVGHAEPAFDDGHLHRHVRRGEPALDRRRGSRIRAGLRGAVAARGAGGAGTVRSYEGLEQRHGGHFRPWPPCLCSLVSLNARELEEAAEWS